MSTRDRFLGTVAAAAETLGIEGREIPTKAAVLGSVVVAVVVLTIIPLAFLLWTSVWSGYPG